MKLPKQYVITRSMPHRSHVVYFRYKGMVTRDYVKLDLGYADVHSVNKPTSVMLDYRRFSSLVKRETETYSKKLGGVCRRFGVDQSFVLRKLSVI